MMKMNIVQNLGVLKNPISLSAAIQRSSSEQLTIKKGVNMIQQLRRFLPIAEKVIARKTTLPIRLENKDG